MQLTQYNLHMGSKFRPYTCTINDSKASFMVDLDLAAQAPIQAKPWFLYVLVGMLAPRADGLYSTEEAPKLYEIEEALIEQLGSSVGAIFCGRITTSNRRDFYFYGETSEQFAEVVQRAMAEFAGYKFASGVKHDPEWSNYKDVLYPRPDELERIANGDVLAALADQGDNHAIPRKVAHWAYFPTSKYRSQFIGAVLEKGFGVESERKVKGKLPFCACIFRVQSIEPVEINKITIELNHLAQTFDGNYDGWEAPLTTN